MAEIKEDEWFKRNYTPANPDEDEEDVSIDDEALTMHEVIYNLDTLCDYS